MTYPFAQAKYYTVGRGGTVPRLIVIHTMETPETYGRARQVWRWFWGKTSPKASAHYMTDATTIEQSVKETDTAWAVGDYILNRASISIELSGEASQTKAQWADAYSQAELTLVAGLVKEIATRQRIPLVRLTPADILAGKSGLCGHIDITIAKKIKGGHTDPGAHFPWIDLFVKVATHV